MNKDGKSVRGESEDSIIPVHGWVFSVLTAMMQSQEDFYVWRRYHYLDKIMDYEESFHGKEM